MPAAQIASIEADHDCRGHRINVGICGTLGSQPRDTLADAAGSIAHRAAVDGACHGQQLSIYTSTWGIHALCQIFNILAEIQVSLEAFQFTLLGGVLGTQNGIITG